MNDFIDIPNDAASLSFGQVLAGGLLPFIDQFQREFAIRRFRTALGSTAAGKRKAADEIFGFGVFPERRHG